MLSEVDKNGNRRPIPNVLLKQLQSSVPGHTHRNVSIMTNDPTYNWANDGRPCIWSLVDCDGTYKVLFDEGYGYMALVKGVVLLAVGKDVIVTEHCVALKKQVYGTTKYIWR